jgi:hypothetical protein
MADKIRANYVEGVVKSITGGSNVTVDNTDPENPVISASVDSGDTLPTASADNQYVGWNGSAFVARQIQYNEIAGAPPEVTDFVSKANGGQFDSLVYVRSQIGLRNGSDQNRALLDLNADNGRLRLYDDTGVAMVSLQAHADSYIFNQLGIRTTNPEHDLHVAGSIFGDNLQTGGLLMFANNVRSKDGTDLEIQASTAQQVKLRVSAGESINIMADRYAQFMRRSGLAIEGIAGFDSAGRIGEINLSTDFDIVSGELVFTGGVSASTDTLDDVAGRNGTTSAAITINNTLAVSGQVTFSNLSDGMVVASNGVLSTQAVPQAASGTSGYLPVFDASADGVGDSSLQEISGALKLHEIENMDYLNAADARRASISLLSVSANKTLPDTIIGFMSGSGIMTAQPGDDGSSGFQATNHWKLGGPQNDTSNTVDRVIRIQIADTQYDLLARRVI